LRLIPRDKKQQMRIRIRNWFDRIILRPS